MASSLFKQQNRFKLEERITRAWSTSDDIEDFIVRFYEHKDRMTDDEVFNLVWGIKEMHDTRMKILMETFKQVFYLDEYKPCHNFDQERECND